MKRLYIHLLVVGLAGCTGPRSDSATDHDVVSASTNSEFDRAIETIATSTDVDSVRAADAALRAGGIPAIDALRKHLSDKRVPPSNYLTRAVTGAPTMGDHVFWLIQDMIETPVPKLYRSRYSVLTPNNVEPWLDDHDGKSIRELQIAAASASLDRAKHDFDAEGDSHAQKVIGIYSERLRELRRTE